MLALLILTASRETLEALKKMDLFYLIVSIVMWFIYMTLDAARISLIIHGISGRWGKLSTGYNILFTGAFLAAVTPFQTGGLPVQLYIMKREKIPWGKGTLVILLRGVFYGIMVLVLLPFLIPILLEQTQITSVRILSRYSFIIYGFAVLLIGFILIKPNVLKRFLYRVSMRKGKRTKFTRWVYKIFKEIHEMREGFYSFAVEKKWHTAASFFLTFITYIPYFFIAPFLLKGLGIDISFIKAAFFQLVVVIFTFFSPTPGATGVAEGGFALLFSPFVAKHLLGVFTIIWRFFTFYLTAIIGGFVTLKIIRLGGEEIEKK